MRFSAGIASEELLQCNHVKQCLQQRASLWQDGQPHLANEGARCRRGSAPHWVSHSSAAHPPLTQSSGTPGCLQADSMLCISVGLYSCAKSWPGQDRPSMERAVSKER